MALEPQRRHSPMLDLLALQPEEARHATPEPSRMLDALELDITPSNLLAIGWTLARGEFEGLRVETPVRMTWQAAAWL